MSKIESHDYVIIGAGPAGLQLAYFLEKAGRDYVVLEAAERAGAFFESFPRHRTLISINKVHTTRSEPDFRLRHDWNSIMSDAEELRFTRYSKEYFPPADTFVRYCADFAEHFRLKIRYGTRVARVTRDPSGTFELTCGSDVVVRAKRLIVATGLFKPQIPDVPGIELAEGYETLDTSPDRFEGKTVLILGKANSALETANALIPHAAMIHLISPRPLKLAWDTHFVGHIRAVNDLFIEAYLLKAQGGVIDGVVRSIEKLPTGKLRVRWSSCHADVDEVEQLEYDHVIRCTGFRFDGSIFSESCAPELAHDGKVPKMTGAWESTNVPNLYFAGALMQSLDFKRAQSAFIHGFRHNVRTLFHLLEERHENTPYPTVPIPLVPETLAKSILDRMNVCASLWQQVRHLCDVIPIPKDRKPGQTVAWYRDLSIDHALERFGQGDDEYYVISFQYGPYEGTIFDHPHVHPPNGPLCRGKLSTEIHPNIQRYRGRELQIDYHVMTDFLTDWNARYYSDPLAAFFAEELFGQRTSEERPYAKREFVRSPEMRVVDVRVE